MNSLSASSRKWKPTNSTAVIYIIRDEEWKRHVLAMALTELKGHVQPETYVAFEMYALQERPVQEVAKFLNLSVASVYTAKSRCIAALKEIISKLEEQ